jgi:16S rRNA (guanine527-N7)-methyltransferase
MNDGIGNKIKDAVAAAGLPLDASAVGQLNSYVSLILRWSARVNLTSLRDEDGIISRHIIESIEVSNTLPAGIGTLLDFGSGAGLPGIPIAVCRPDIQVTLAESQNKKAAFLMEAVRVLGLTATVHSGRAEELKTQFDCVTLRAVDKMARAVKSAASLVTPSGWLALMTTTDGLSELQSAAGPGFDWASNSPVVGSGARILAIGRKVSSQA